MPCARSCFLPHLPRPDRLVFDINIREYADAYDDEQADGAMYTFLGGMHRLQVLDLGDAYFDATCIAILAALPALESLALARSDPTDVMFLPPDAPLQLPESPFSKLTRLRAERFNTIDRLGSGVMGRILGAMPALRNLHLSFSDWGDLDGVLAVKGLERLTVEESEMDEGPAITDGWLLRLSRACTNLVSLSLWTDSYYDGISADDAAVTASGFALLPSALTRLESLELRGFTCVRPESLVALCLASPSLRQLRLRLVEYAATSGMTSAEQEAALDDLRGVAAARLPHPLLVAVESDDEDGDQDDEDSYKYFDETDDDEGGGSGAVE